VLGWVLERATHESLTRFMTEQLWKPAGFESYGAWIARWSARRGAASSRVVDSTPWRATTLASDS